MKILLVSSYLPYPLHSGGHVRLYNILKEISKNHEITLVCEKRDNQTQEDVKEVSKFCRVITLPRKKQWTIKNIFKAAFSKYPFLLIGHMSPEMKAIIVKLLIEKHFDLIHVETFYVFQNIPKTYLPIVLVEHNVEYLVYMRYVKSAKFYLYPFLLLDVSKIKFWEEKFWNRATKLIAVSEKEKELMKREDVAVVSNGVDIDLFKMKSPALKNKRKEKKVLFIGDFKWIQNRQAIEFILNEIWGLALSKLKDKNIKATLWIVGKNIPQNFKDLPIENVIFDENATDETWKIYHKSDVLLAPITVGGGTSYKIIESMATGLPVVTTNLGIEGIGAKADKEVLVAETAEEIANNVCSLLENNSLYEKIAQNARSFVEHKFTWKEITKALEQVYKNVV